MFITIAEYFIDMFGIATSNQGGKTRANTLNAEELVGVCG
jgi:hypothetical protein